MIDYHVQCLFQKDVISGDLDEKIDVYFQTSWIPEQYARVGNSVKLKNENGEWEDGWFIYFADTDHKMESKYVNERGQDYKRTRKASDI